MVQAVDHVDGEFCPELIIEIGLVALIRRIIVEDQVVPQPRVVQVDGAVALRHGTPIGTGALAEQAGLGERPVGTVPDESLGYLGEPTRVGEDRMRGVGIPGTSKRITRVGPVGGHRTVGSDPEEVVDSECGVPSDSAVHVAGARQRRAPWGLGRSVVWAVHRAEEPTAGSVAYVACLPRRRGAEAILGPRIERKHERQSALQSGVLSDLRDGLCVHSYRVEPEELRKRRLDQLVREAHLQQGCVGCGICLPEADAVASGEWRESIRRCRTSAPAGGTGRVADVPLDVVLDEGDDVRIRWVGAHVLDGAGHDRRIDGGLVLSSLGPCRSKVDGKGGKAEEHNQEEPNDDSDSAILV